MSNSVRNQNIMSKIGQKCLNRAIMLEIGIQCPKSEDVASNVARWCTKTDNNVQNRKMVFKIAQECSNSDSDV